MRVQNISFFGRFKRCLSEAGSDDLGGRYLSAVLATAFNEAPDIMSKALFGSRAKASMLRASNEFSYAPGCKADICIFDDRDAVVGLIEIKYEDHLHAANMAQLRKYLEFADDAGVHFIYLTKHFPSNDCMALLTQNRREPRFLSDIYNTISQHIQQKRTGTGAATLQMLLEFLREESPMYNHDLNRNAAGMFLRRAFYLDGFRFGREQTPEAMLAAAQIPSIALNNAEALGIRLRNAARDLFGQRFVIDYSLEPKLSPTALQRSTKIIANDATDVYGHGICDGGGMHVWAHGRLRSAPGAVYVWIGHYIEISNKKVGAYHYAGVGNQKSPFEDYWDARWFPRESEAFNASLEIIDEQIPAASKVHPEWRNSLAELKERLRSHR